MIILNTISHLQTTFEEYYQCKNSFLTWICASLEWLPEWLQFKYIILICLYTLFFLTFIRHFKLTQKQIDNWIVSVVIQSHLPMHFCSVNFVLLYIFFSLFSLFCATTTSQKSAVWNISVLFQISPSWLKAVGI